MARKIRVGGHPIHPPLTAFPIGILTIGLVWEIVAFFAANPMWWQFAFWSLVAGLALSALTAVSGFIDFAAIPQDDPAEGMAIWHMTANVTAVLLFIGSAISIGNLAPPSDTRKYLAVALAAAGFIVLGAGGWLGGHLVFHYGIGVDEKPPPVPQGTPPGRP